MNLDELRHCIATSFGPRPTQSYGLAFHLMGFCWPGGTTDRSDPRGRSRRLWSDLATLPLSSCTCDSGRCLLCN